MSAAAGMNLIMHHPAHFLPESAVFLIQPVLYYHKNPKNKELLVN